MVPAFYNVWERCMTENYGPVSLHSVVSKVFERLVNNKLVDHLEKCAGLLDPLQIFRRLYLIEFIGLLISLGLLEF